MKNGRKKLGGDSTLLLTIDLQYPMVYYLTNRSKG